MDNSPLNAAHQQHRRAEASMRYRKYDEAIICHERAAQLLEDALLMTTSCKAVESLKLQQEYHRKQKLIAQANKEQFEILKRNLEKQKIKMAKHLNGNNSKENNSNNLQLAFNKLIDDADSKMDILVKRFYSNESDSELNSIEKGLVSCHNLNDGGVVSGQKEPKSDNVVIEELQTLNQQLREFVNQLILELEVSNQECETLRSRLAILEGEKNPPQADPVSVSPQASPRLPQTTPLNVITDSVGETSSPFVFSPCGELSPEPLAEIKELPPLAPLEMPDFDFEALISKIKIRNGNGSMYKSSDSSMFRSSDNSMFKKSENRESP